MTEPDLPFSQSCENNKQPILAVLQQYITAPPAAQNPPQLLLEIAGGTGQHAVFLASQFPFLRWQSSDIPENRDSLNLRLSYAALPNLPAAITLDVQQSDWGVPTQDYLFSANSLHIMSLEAVRAFFAGAAPLLKPGGLLFVYGPFKYKGAFTTDSNAGFDQWLKSRNPLSGIRDIETVCSLAEKGNLALLADHEMPANNQLLVWRKGR